MVELHILNTTLILYAIYPDVYILADVLARIALFPYEIELIFMSAYLGNVIFQPLQLFVGDYY